MLSACSPEMDGSAPLGMGSPPSRCSFDSLGSETADWLTRGSDSPGGRRSALRESLWRPFTIARSVAVKERVCVGEVAAELRELIGISAKLQETAGARARSWSGRTAASND
jgi:hypothetical protein